MERREFLRTPALGMLLPGAISLTTLDRSEPAAGPPDPTGAGTFSQRLHQDFETYVPGVEYFPLGNGEIAAILQFCPNREGDRPQSYLGFTIMDGERFGRKWSSFLFHPERGLDRSMAGVRIGATTYTANPDTFRSVGWKHPDGVPVISLRWVAGPVDVEEEFFVPSTGPMVFRVVRLTNTSSAPVDARVSLALVASFALFDDIGPDEKENTIHASGFARMKLECMEPGAKALGRYDILAPGVTIAPGAGREVRFVYRIRETDGLVTTRRMKEMLAATRKYWGARQAVVTGNSTLDHLYAVSRNGLRALLARSGRRDSGYWMYNMQWARDDSMVVIGLLQAGHIEEARVLLVKILEQFIGPDGCTVEASRRAPNDATELDQNGQVLYAVWMYLCWTGDETLVRKYWSKIRLTGNFPLQSDFRDPRARMLHNKREFWERGEGFGVEDGFELSYQFWVALGLEKGSAIARLLGDRATADTWERAAAELRDAMLNDPAFRLIEEGRLIKRRTQDGRWQRYFVPANRAAMPPGSPIATEERPAADPDTSSVYPIIYEMLDPRGDIARATLDGMEELWNQRWTTGGYARYNTSSEPDPGGGWPFASLYIARANVEAGNSVKVWQVLNWLETIHGGLSGGWFERYGPSITPPAPPVCITGWTWAEVVMLVVQHIMGLRPDLNRLILRPRLISGIDTMSGVFALRGSRIDVSVRRTGTVSARVNNKTVPADGDRLVVKYPARGTTLRIDMTV